MSVNKTLEKKDHQCYAMADVESLIDRRMQKPYTEYTYYSFAYGTKHQLTEINKFKRWLDQVEALGEYTFESEHTHAQTPIASIRRQHTGEALSLISLANYNYLGYGYHPEVIQAAKDALDQYGLGAASTPVISGTFTLHKQLEEGLVDFFGLPDRGVSLFSSGYAVNTGTISAFMKPGTHIILDRAAHMSIFEGAQLSRARVHYFEHNNMESLESILKQVSQSGKRILICVEGVYSTDGDEGDLRGVVRLAKQYGAWTLVDEAHSVLVGGPNGRGIAEAQGVLADIDLYVMTFSKGFAGIGGALLAKKEITRYINWYARSRMFSCAMDPAVTGGILKALMLASGPDGQARRQRIRDNAELMRQLLADRVNVLTTNTWIIPIIYGDEKLTFPLNDYLQRQGLDVGLMTFPAVPRNEARIRLFITSEHTEAQLRQAAAIIIEAAERFGFALPNDSSTE